MFFFCFFHPPQLSLSPPSLFFPSCLSLNPPLSLPLSLSEYVCRSTCTLAHVQKCSSFPWLTAAAISRSQTAFCPGTPTVPGTVRVAPVSASTSTAGEHACLSPPLPLCPCSVVLPSPLLLGPSSALPLLSGLGPPVLAAAQWMPVAESVGQ